MNKRNLGRFSVTEDAIARNPDMMAMVFCMLNIVIVRAEFRYDRGTFEYLAIGDQFEELPENAAAPEYRVDISVDENGDILNVKAVKI